MDKKQIGAFLKELRKEKGLTQDEFAQEFSKFCFGDVGLVSDATISKWERGESLPNVEDIRRLAQFYDITIDEILNGEKLAKIDFGKKYFLANEHWYHMFSKDDSIQFLHNSKYEIKTISLEKYGTLQESISLPFFKYCDKESGQIAHFELRTSGKPAFRLTTN